MKARSPADAKKWVWALKESRMWLSDSSKASGNEVHSRRTSIVEGQGLKALDLFQREQVLLSANLNPGSAASTFDVNLGNEETSNSSKHADLYSFLDSQSANELQNPEMRRFLTLLKTEMHVQKETVESAITMLNHVAAGNEKEKISKSALETLPVILTDSGQHIESLILGIVRYCIKREVMWEQKLNRANEAHKRLEDILHQIASSSSSKEGDENDDKIKINVKAVLPPTSLLIKKNSGYVTSEDGDVEDEEFYDAQEGSASPGTLLATSPRKVPGEFKLEDESANMSEVGSERALVEFCNPNDLQATSKGYETIHPYRESLPLDPNVPKPSLAVWSFLKNAIGKDLSKVTLPVIFNEPISMLQRMCEDIEYIELLSLASRVGSHGNSPTQHLPDQPAKICASRLKLDYSKLEKLQGVDASMFRLMFVAAFAMSNYSSTAGRTNKPFNPLLV